MISIITPVHAKAAPFLREAYDSLCQQSLTEWEWVTVTNAGGVVPEDIAADPRVKVFSIEDDDPQHNRIGRLKAAACALATGEILVELDADDLLLPNALAEIAQAFEDPGVAMAYSNSAEFRDGTWASSGYSDYFGWRSRPFFHAGHELREMIAWPPSPQMMRFIFWAPNHVRCWRTAAYKSVGGHDPAIKTGDDHDLCCRFFIQYGAAGLRHIDRCLYLYRLHGQNSCVVHNDEVQIQTLANYQKYSRDMAIRWAKAAGLQLLDLCGRRLCLASHHCLDLFQPLLHHRLVLPELTLQLPNRVC
jgi:glycosyltransferase involved in cell wall biosynthesis